MHQIIDYVKENETDPWRAENVRNVNSRGLEANIAYGYRIDNHMQKIAFGYTFLKDDVKNLDISYSQYSVNSLKHHLTANYTSQFVKNVTQTLVYKYAERTSGDSYAVVDANVTVSLLELKFTLLQIIFSILLILKLIWCLCLKVICFSGYVSFLDNRK